MLKFGKGNAKLGKSIHTFSLPAGWSCPGANECKSKVVIVDGKRKVEDGPDCKFRCFAASSEVVYTKTYEARQHNFEALKGLTGYEMTRLIQDSLPKRAKYVRLHVSGDFFSQAYFDAWIEVARCHPNILFYAYTKSLNYWVARFSLINLIPANFVLTASVGGRYDSLISTYNLRSARVVFSEEEAAKLGLPIDHDDSHAMKPKGNFALLLHGTQPKNSEAAAAKKALKGKGSYPAKKQKVASDA